jgi:hypothetical protein
VIEGLHERLLGCVARTREIDVRVVERKSGTEAHAALVPSVSSLLVESVEVCQALLAHYDAEEATKEDDLDAAFGEWSEERGSGVFYLSVDAALDHAGRRVADIAFIGVTELRVKLGRVRALTPDRDGWDIVAECGSGIRRTRKSLTALERVMSEAEGWEPKLGFESELAVSLEVRRQYSRLRGAIARHEQATEENLHRSLRRVGTAIAMLIGREIYPDLRLDDRRQIRELQARILDWLRDEDMNDEKARAGMRLWQDLAGFSSLIEQVSRRQELQSHDAKVLKRVEGALAGGSPMIERDLAVELRALRGLDDEVDALLDQGEMLTAIWQPVIDRVGARFRETPPTAGGGGPSESREEQAW